MALRGFGILRKISCRVLNLASNACRGRSSPALEMFKCKDVMRRDVKNSFRRAAARRILLLFWESPTVWLSLRR